MSGLGLALPGPLMGLQADDDDDIMAMDIPMNMPAPANLAWGKPGPASSGVPQGIGMESSIAVGAGSRTVLRNPLPATS